MQAGDLVLSRDEFNLDGEVGPKRIEEVFVRQGELYELRVGGRVIHVTPEHPLFVHEKGWTPAGEVAAGDLLSAIHLPQPAEQAAAAGALAAGGADASGNTAVATAEAPVSAWLEVESIGSTGVFTTVYNFRVADWHTYFVGRVLPHLNLEFCSA